MRDKKNHASISTTFVVEIIHELSTNAKTAKEKLLLLERDLALAFVCFVWKSQQLIHRHHSTCCCELLRLWIEPLGVMMQVLINPIWKVSIHTKHASNNGWQSVLPFSGWKFNYVYESHSKRDVAEVIKRQDFPINNHLRQSIGTFWSHDRFPELPELFNFNSKRKMNSDDVKMFAAMKVYLYAVEIGLKRKLKKNPLSWLKSF